MPSATFCDQVDHASAVTTARLRALAVDSPLLTACV